MHLRTCVKLTQKWRMRPQRRRLPLLQALRPCQVGNPCFLKLKLMTAEVLSSALQRYFSDAGLVVKLCAKLQSRLASSWSASNLNAAGGSSRRGAEVTELLRDGFASALAETLRRHVSDGAVQTAVCDVLVALRRINEAGIDELTRAGVFKQLLATLKRKDTSAAVAAVALSALSNFSWASKQIAEAGGLALIAKTMTVHADSLAVVKEACCTFGNYAFSTFVHYPEADVVEAVTAAMRRHRDDAHVARLACWALVGAARNYACLTAFERAGATPLLCAAIERFGEASSVLGTAEHAFYALYHFCGEDPSDSEGPKAALVARHGPIGAGIAAMRKELPVQIVPSEADAGADADAEAEGAAELGAGAGAGAGVGGAAAAAAAADPLPRLAERGRICLMSPAQALRLLRSPWAFPDRFPLSDIKFHAPDAAALAAAAWRRRRAAVLARAAAVAAGGRR